MDSLFMRFPDFKSKAVTLSYDDGLIQDRRLMEILDKYGLKCTFNISSGFFNDDDKAREYGRMTKKQCLELYTGSGHEVAIHGENHKYMEQLPISAAMSEIISDRRRLESVFKNIIKGMAYPYGTYNTKILEILKNAEISYARTTKSTEEFALPENWLILNPTCKHTNPKFKELTNRFISMEVNTAPQMFYLWGHSSEYDRDNNWEVIEEFAKKIGKCDCVWKATNIEIYDYVKAYKTLEFSVDMTICYNPAAKEIFFNYGGFDCKISPGEVIKLKK